MKKDTKKNLALSLVFTISTNLISIPIKAFTNKSALYGRDNIINIIKNKSCKTCFNFDINWIVYIVQIITSFFIFYFILYTISKRRNKNG